MITSIVFDCFGVLYEDALKNYIERYVDASSLHPKQYYYDLSLAHDRGHISDDEFYTTLAALSDQDPSIVHKHIRSLTVLNQPLIDLITELKPHYKIGMLSNAERTFLDQFLANHDIKHLFDAVLASSETPFAKPERGIFEEMSRRLDAPFDQMLFIDDSPTHTSAATSYGMSAVTYVNPAQLRTDLSQMIGPSSPQAPAK